jgi:dipeptidyl aminopeptidase/acylaminoacyl peptidase
MRKLLIGLTLAAASSCASVQAGSDKATDERNRAAIQKALDALTAGDKPVAKAAAPKDPLLAPFLATGSFTSMSLSPDGKHVATLLSDGFDSAVAIIDTDTMEMRNIVEPRIVMPHNITSNRIRLGHTRSPRFVAWVADDLLAVNFNDGSSVVTLDGKETHDLFAGWRMQVRDADGRATDWAIVRRDFDEPGHFSRVNIRTGENYSIDVEVEGKLLEWVADARGDIRVATTMNTAVFSDSTRLTTWMRADSSSPWRKIDERSILDDPFRPLQVVTGSDRLVVQARNGGDRLAIWDFDPASKAFGATLAANPDADIVHADAGEIRTGVVDVMSDGLRLERTWFEPRMARLQASLDASLPDHVNVMLAQQPSTRMIVFSYSDVDPGRWFLFEPGAMKMKELVARLPDIAPARMLPMRTLRYPSFDGTSVPAYLTLPGKPVGPVPLIVLIHGGPQERDRWQWDRDAQVFATHGYAVFQPQFRGSTGFGKKFEEAGYGQWGQAMQDDITAGVRYLIAQKIAAPERICIVGASYGGYAALWGLAKTPELYKCGVSTAGVSDLEHMLHDDSDTSESAVGREIERSRVGDPKLMKATWSSVSPLQQADRIVAPLLIVHGDLDRRVPISHGKKMLVEMQRLHKDVAWLEFSDEGHGVTTVPNVERWYGAMFALFERTIGKGEPPFPIIAPAPAAAASAGR